MACDMPCMSYMALYVISMHIVNSNSRSSASSNHWKLNVSAGKVEPASYDLPTTNNNTDTPGSRSNEVKGQTGGHSYHGSDLEDKMMQILSNSKLGAGGEWVVAAPHKDTDVHAGPEMATGTDEDATSKSKDRPKPEPNRGSPSKPPKKSKSLSCGKKVNLTIYDHLKGVSERHLHTHIPEPDVAMVFKNSGKSSEVDMRELEGKLRKAKKDVEKSGKTQSHQAAQVYNLIGNFWRIKGNTNIAIECFRKALSILPEDPDILLNLARVLFNVQYLDDAIYLARRSLSLQPPQDNSWLQHFTLGEILKSYGQSTEAAMHFNQALELNPGFQPAKSHLRDLDPEPQPSVTHLTVFIIVFLVVGVLLGVLTSLDAGMAGEGSSGVTGESSKSQQRHFNRAMAMRSIKLGVNPRLCRLRRAAANS